MQDGTGNTTYTYDALDRKWGVQDQASLLVSYTYDAVGQRAKTYTTSSVSGEGVALPITYTYDGAGRLTTLFNSNTNSAHYSYDAADRRTHAIVGLSYVVTTTVYDAADRIVGLVATNPAHGVTLTNYAYRYDALGNRLGATEVDGSLVTWTYDSTYQLVGEQRTDAGGSTTLTYNTTYTYDPLGNRLVKWDSGSLTTSTYDVANQLQTAVTGVGPHHVHLRSVGQSADRGDTDRHHHDDLGQ